MNKIAGILILSIIFSGCTQRPVRPDFKFIEFSVWNEMGGSTVRLDSNGQLNRCKYKIIQDIESCDCYCDTINSDVINTINQFLNKISTQKIDSTYDLNCQDCEGYLLRMKTKKFEILTQVGEIRNNKTIDSLILYLRTLPLNAANHVDSCLMFETTNFLIPPKIY
jgi:hypothetical protein